MMLEERPHAPRRRNSGEGLDRPVIVRPLVKVLELVIGGVRLEEMEHFNMFRYPPRASHSYFPMPF